MSVPLDYLNKHDNRTASIAITRYLASKQSADTGTLIFNPGGPGGSGTGSTYRLGPILDVVLEGQYDILGFDPRGINKTLPTVTCLSSNLARFSLSQTVENTAPSINLHDVGIWDAVSQIVAEECENNSGTDILPFVNTPTVARDIASIIDALHEQKRHHVSYWGFSYGTNLGAIFTGLFPNKLHKIILDGIRSPLDARELYNWGYTSLASQDDVFDGYFSICDAVGPKRCPIASSDNATSSKQTFLNLLDTLYSRPLPVISNTSIGLVTSFNYKVALYGTLYRPVSWPVFAAITADLLNGNGTSFLETFSPASTLSDSGAGTAVLCTDAVPATNYTLASWKSYVQNMTSQSFIAGDSRALDTLPCRHWYSLPNERWTGDFHTVSTSSDSQSNSEKKWELEVPILMIGNTYDPATPIASARRLVKEMGEGTNAVLVEQKSYGHCSISSVSSCTYDILLKYLLKGEVPEVGSVCEVDGKDYEGYFPSEKENLNAQGTRELFRGLVMNEIGMGGGRV